MSDMERLTIDEVKNKLEVLKDWVGDISLTRQDMQHCIDETIQALDEFQRYRDLAEQGRLMVLPCPIGSDVYFVPSKTNFNLNVLQGRQAFNRVYHQRVHIISFNANGWYFETDLNREYGIDRLFVDKEYKEIWFLTETEAEAKLKELEGGA